MRKEQINNNDLSISPPATISIASSPGLRCSQEKGIIIRKPIAKLRGKCYNKTIKMKMGFLLWIRDLFTFLQTRRFRSM